MSVTTGEHGSPSKTLTALTLHTEDCGLHNFPPERSLEHVYDILA